MNFVNNLGINPLKKIPILQHLKPDFQSLRGRLIWTFTGMGILCLLLAAYPIYQHKVYINQYEFLLENTVHAQRYSGVIEICLSKSNSALDNYLITNDGHFTNKRNRIWEKEFRPALDSLLTYTRRWNNEVVATLVYDISVKANRLRSEQDFAVRQYSAALFQGDILQTEANKDRKTQISQIDMLTEDILAVLDNLIGLQEQEIVRLKNEIRDNKEELNIQIGILCLISVAIYAFVATITTLSFLRKINLIKYQVKQMSEGNIPSLLTIEKDETSLIIKSLNELTIQLSSIKKFALSIGERKTNTEMPNLQGEVGNAFTQMTKGLKQVADEEARRNWAASGHNQFAKILIEYNTDLQILSEAVISELIKYLSASHGAMYIANHDLPEEPLEMIACYAYGYKKFRQVSILKGEGLIGQVYQEKRTLQLSEVPEDYVQLITGLGQSKPRALLITPLKMNDQVYGVVEMASHKPFQPFEVAFIEEVCKNTASSLVNLQTNTKTRKLLREAQQQAEMLRAQEEEMRQNLEELQATQEELSRQGKELDAYVQAVKSTAIVIELDYSRKIMNVNDLFVEKTGFSKKEVLGQDILTILPKEIKEDYLSGWMRLEKGLNFSNEIKWEKTTGQFLWTRSMHVPLLDSSRRLMKVISLHLDVSEEKRTKEILKDMQLKERFEAPSEKLLRNPEATKPNMMGIDVIAEGKVK
jgi:PAS domain S-box-containing protein